MKITPATDNSRRFLWYLWDIIFSWHCSHHCKTHTCTAQWKISLATFSMHQQHSIFAATKLLLFRQRGKHDKILWRHMWMQHLLDKKLSWPSLKIRKHSFCQCRPCAIKEFSCAYCPKQKITRRKQDRQIWMVPDPTEPWTEKTVSFTKRKICSETAPMDQGGMTPANVSPPPDVARWAQRCVHSFLSTSGFVIPKFVEDWHNSPTLISEMLKSQPPVFGSVCVLVPWEKKCFYWHFIQGVSPHRKRWLRRKSHAVITIRADCNIAMQLPWVPLLEKSKQK